MSKPLIHERYRVIRQIGRGAQGATYLAHDERADRDVALKELDFAGVGSWDSVSVFEREVAVLGGLDHPQIPRVLESFRVEEPGELRLFLVQEFVEGDDLQQRLDDGELFDEGRLRLLAAAVLEILAYLHGNSPPVLHRDVKPANLVERPDGHVALVDFGAAQGSQRGEAVIGTTGYMPAEQLMGRATPASDLYALGATLIHLATRKHPSDLGEGLGLRWREFVNLSDKFAAWLDRLVAPMPEDRFPTALAASRALEEISRRRRRTRDVRDDLLLKKDREPSKTKAGRYELQRSFGRLLVTCPTSLPRGFSRGLSWLIALPLLLLAILFPVIAAANLGFLFGAFAVAFGLRASGRLHPFIKELHGHDRGLDIVWAGEEVVQRVLLEDISGPDLEPITVGHALVLWTRDGKRLTLDEQYGSAADARLMRAVILAWLAEARRRR